MATFANLGITRDTALFQLMVRRGVDIQEAERLLADPASVQGLVDAGDLTPQPLDAVTSDQIAGVLNGSLSGSDFQTALSNPPTVDDSGNVVPAPTPTPTQTDPTLTQDPNLTQDPTQSVTPPPTTPLPLPPAPTQTDSFVPPTFNQPLPPGPGTGFQVDPRDSEKVLASLSHFVNAMFDSQQAGLTSGSFTNPSQIAGPLQGLFNQSADPNQFNNFQNQLSGFGTGNPLGDQVSQALGGQIGQNGLGGSAGQLGLQQLMQSLFGQPSGQSLSTGRASQGLEGQVQQQQAGGPQFGLASGGIGNLGSVSGNLLGQPSQQSLSTGRASQGLGDLSQRLTSGGDGLGGVANTLLGQPGIQSLSTGRASNLFNQLGSQGGGTGSSLQGFIDQQLRGSIAGGGLSPETVQAQRQNILQPALERQAGINNAQGGGVASLQSGLFQDVNRRLESDFLNNQLIQANQNLQSQFGQAGQLGQQQFGNLFGIGQAQGQLGQNQQQINQGAIGLGAGLQNQGIQQLLQTFAQQGQLGQNQQQINQQAIGLGGQLQQQDFSNLFNLFGAQGQLGQQQQQINQNAFGIGGQLQDQLAQQGLQGTQLGLGREQFQGELQQQQLQQALQFMQLMNLFNLGQTDIASSLTRQLLGGAQIASPKGSFLNALVAGGASVASSFVAPTPPK